MDDDLLVFDLRNGRVGGLTFCGVVQGWFDPDQSFMIDNDLDIAVTEWRGLASDRRRRMRFVWGHNFSAFQRRVDIGSHYKVVGLVRHPLLKVSGARVRSFDDLRHLKERSVQDEFERYVNEGGNLPTTSVIDFLNAHFMVGITEHMEESLFLLRAKLGLDVSMREWERLGSEADLQDNLYSSGLLRNFVQSEHYWREMEIYNHARSQFLSNFNALKLDGSQEYKDYKASCQNRDATISKWASAYPQIFSLTAGNVGSGLGTQLRKTSWLGEVLATIRRTLTKTRIIPRRGYWKLVVGSGEANTPDAERRHSGRCQVKHSRFLLKILPLVEGRSSPNMIGIDLNLPPVDQRTRWVACSIMGREIFRADVGPAAGVRRFEIPISRRVTEVAFDFGGDSDDTPSGSRVFAIVQNLHVLSVPIG